MAPILLLFALLATCLAQQPQQPPAQEPPEEDAVDRPKEYAFNPLQATKEFNVGLFNGKRGNWKGAAMRFEEATKWNPGYAEAYLKWAEALEKQSQADKAREIYAKFLEVAPDHKEAARVKRKLGPSKAARN